jgi:hypothetical protein
MHLAPRTRWFLRVCTALTLFFLYLPLAVIALYAFNERRVQTWPIPGFTLEWFDRAFHNPGVRDALGMSLKAGLGATAIAIVLGSLAAFAVSRYRFFGRETVSFLVILPIGRRHGRDRPVGDPGLHRPAPHRRPCRGCGPGGRDRGRSRAVGRAGQSTPMRFGGQYVAKAPPMIQLSGTGPQKRLSSDAPRLSPMRK